RARGYRYQVLREVRCIVCRADGADAVVDVDVDVAPEVASGEQRHRVVGSARTEALLFTGRRQVHGRQDRQHGNAAGAGPQPKLGADLHVADAGRSQSAKVLRDQAVGADTNLDPVGQPDTRGHRRAAVAFAGRCPGEEAADLDLQQADVDD